jgi:hypothetical protein
MILDYVNQQLGTGFFLPHIMQTLQQSADIVITGVCKYLLFKCKNWQFDMVLTFIWIQIS